MDVLQKPQKSWGKSTLLLDISVPEPRKKVRLIMLLSKLKMESFQYSTQ
jgi:hypothetical protein